MKEFEYPEYEIIVLGTEDIITASGCQNAETEDDDCTYGDDGQ